MGPTYHSGAFAQQCFAVHPLCLSVKRLDAEGRLILSCSSCKMGHRLTLSDVATRLSVVAHSDEPGMGATPRLGMEALISCAEAHPLVLSVREMDVIQNRVGLRCAECRRIYELTVPQFETHQR